MVLLNSATHGFDVSLHSKKSFYRMLLCISDHITQLVGANYSKIVLFTEIV